MLPSSRLRKGVLFLLASVLVIGIRSSVKIVDYVGAKRLFVREVVHGPLESVGGLGAENSVLNAFAHDGYGSSRHLLALVNCTPRAVEQFPRDVFDQAQRSSGAILIHIFVVIYMFLGLAIVCDSYFVPSLEVLCDVVHLQTDVAGATLMAAGSSAPELATAIIGVMVAKDDVGLSTVVGSAIYNIMFVISVCGLAAGTAIHLNWWPLVRDCMAYLVSIAALVLALYDENIQWYESVCFVLCYMLYILFMYHNQPLEKWCVPRCTCCPPEASEVPDQVIVHYEKMDNGERPHHETTSILSSNSTHNHDDSDSLEETATEIHKIAPEEDSIWSRPRNRWACLLWGFSLPLSLVMYYTVPDCRIDHFRRWFLVTFVMSLIWLSIFSFLMVWMMTIIGFTFNIPDSVMSLTFIAFGVSLPDVVASVIVIKDGLGDMAISNAVGSNVFDILICLGIPWLLKTCIIDPGSEVQVYSEGLLYSSITLLSTVGILLLTIHLNKWTLDKKISIFFMFVYISYSILASMYELNFFGYFHPAECPSDY